LLYLLKMMHAASVEFSNRPSSSDDCAVSPPSVLKQKRVIKKAMSAQTREASTGAAETHNPEPWQDTLQKQQQQQHQGGTGHLLSVAEKWSGESVGPEVGTAATAMDGDSDDSDGGDDVIGGGDSAGCDYGSAAAAGGGGDGAGFDEYDDSRCRSRYPYKDLIPAELHVPYSQAVQPPLQEKVKGQGKVSACVRACVRACVCYWYGSGSGTDSTSVSMVVRHGTLRDT
jgi:hypothetical protein